MNPPRKRRNQFAEGRLHVLAQGLAHKLLPHQHRSLGVHPALGFKVQADLFEEILVMVVSTGFVGMDDLALGQLQIQPFEDRDIR